MNKFLSALPLLALVSGPAIAAPDIYDFDKDHTHIFFRVNHLGFSEMYGRIKDFDGHFAFSEKDPQESNVDVTMKVASLDTDVAALNKALAGEAFFNAQKFPTMHFKSTGVVVTGTNSGDVTGGLTLLGVTRPVVLHVKYNKSGIHAYTNNYTSGFSADADILRSDFGMKAYIPDVGDEVHIHIEAEGTDPLKHPGNVKTPH